MRNEEVLRRVGTKRGIRKVIRQRQLRFLGHTRSLQQLESVCVTDKVKGRRGRERPRVKLVDSLAIVVGRGITRAQLLQRPTSWRIRHCGKKKLHLSTYLSLSQHIYLVLNHYSVFTKIALSFHLNLSTLHCFYKYYSPKFFH